MALSKALFVHCGLSPQQQSPRLLFNHNSHQQQERSNGISTQQGLSSSSSSTLLRRWGAGMNGVNAKLPLASTSILRNPRRRNGRVVVFAVAAGVPVQSPDGERSPKPKSAAVIQKDDESPKSASLNGGAVSTETTVSITVVGASGDLAKKKIFPALFALYYEGCLPKHFTIYGFARSNMTDEKLRDMISGTLTCRIDQRENCGDKQEEFLKRCFYHCGQYNSETSFSELSTKLQEHEAEMADIGTADNGKQVVARFQ